VDVRNLVALGAVLIVGEGIPEVMARGIADLKSGNGSTIAQATVVVPLAGAVNTSPVPHQTAAIVGVHLVHAANTQWVTTAVHLTASRWYGRYESGRNARTSAATEWTPVWTAWRS